MAEVVDSSAGVGVDGEAVAAEIGDTQLTPDDALEGQDRTPRQLIGDLIRRKQASGSRELIPANDPIAKQIVYKALFS